MSRSGKRRTDSTRRLERECSGRHTAIPAALERLRPHVRRDCLQGGCNAARPCPWVSCAWHLYLDVDQETGAIHYPWTGHEIDEVPYTCALDVADRGGIILEEVGEVMNLTRERVRRLELDACDALKGLDTDGSLADLLVQREEYQGVTRCHDPVVTVADMREVARGVNRLRRSLCDSLVKRGWRPRKWGVYWLWSRPGMRGLVTIGTALRIAAEDERAA